MSNDKENEKKKIISYKVLYNVGRNNAFWDWRLKGIGCEKIFEVMISECSLKENSIKENTHRKKM